ncbi:hypothetical protein SEA_GILDA_1 [Microbacterium phage Gilda]|uniref:Uncharacterized protein n=5 Tax=Krampusvirus krampus TaxID=2734242 RepID=A0A4Y6EH54_9CAUD|nr:hypothetical protein SEA_ANNASERENA_1 [Microbacterium phage AnnaSerena]QCQ57363.1 hypothetical protein SEA_RACHELLA_1 [Microbacterium phage Rachella]QDF18053.1 hypothetical protein SEA_ANAKIN_1 [Microbacterium phage Anakin]QDF18135.1 hypothetical protein SEA_NARUTORUN_1 [Microbacterium phage NarutoRun]QOC58660.1 hypothetical protein SEA_GILDA_1 [Microbacterium phage Gilda]WIC90068.1 hypothetical protein SEA_TEDRO_1 [Microbacterium phage Tedro]
MAGTSLSKASPYEQTFKTRYRRVGRPTGDELAESPYRDPSGGQLDPLLLAVAKRRAQTVVLEEQRSRLADVFSAELKVLRRRGVSEVARDVGVDLAKRAERSAQTGSEG